MDQIIISNQLTGKHGEHQFNVVKRYWNIYYNRQINRIQPKCHQKMWLHHR